MKLSPLALAPGAIFFFFFAGILGGPRAGPAVNIVVIIQSKHVVEIQ